MLYQILRGNFNFISIVMQLVATLFVIMVVLPFHELAHGFAAYKLGDNTAKNQGRLTFNPLHHINYIGAVCLLLVGFGWAEPVPVDPRYFKNPKRDMALVALAGPAANIIAAIVGGFLLKLFRVCVPDEYIAQTWYSAVYYFFFYYSSVNISLAVFNLIPLPPLDGSKILGAFLPHQTYVKMLMNERTLSTILIILVATNVVDTIMTYPSNWLFTFVNFITLHSFY